MPGFAFNPPHYPPTDRDLGLAVLNEDLDRRAKAMQSTDPFVKAYNEWNEKNMLRNEMLKGKEF